MFSPFSAESKRREKSCVMLEPATVPITKENPVTQLPAKIALSTFAALTLAGSLAACSSPATVDNSGDTGVDTDAGNNSNLNTSEEPYNDGTYSSSGSYDTPAGTESIDVTITIADDIVTAVEVEGHDDGNPDVKRYQSEFIGGISDIVVGKDIDELSVDRVAGSSLSSTGFKAALQNIKAQALA
jgi:uncharacterized protein with FMN-binding domain